MYIYAHRYGSSLGSFVSELIITFNFRIGASTSISKMCLRLPISTLLTNLVSKFLFGFKFEASFPNYYSYSKLRLEDWFPNS